MQSKYANMMLIAMAFGSPLAVMTNAMAAPQSPALKPCASVNVEDPAYAILGKSTVVKLGSPVSRMVVGGHAASRAAAPAEAKDKSAQQAAQATPQTSQDSVADVDIALLSPTELFVLGKKAGSMNLVLQSANGTCVVKDIIVTLDPGTLQAKLAELMPEEKDIRIKGAENALVLTGRVSDASRLDDVLALANSYGDGKRVVNLLRVTSPQQVMLEVKIAEVSKKLLDKFGLDYTRLYTSANGLTTRVMSGIFGGGPAVLGQFHPNLSGGAIGGSAVGTISGNSAAASGTFNVVSQGATLLGIDAEKKDGLIRVLAEPNIMAISGQAASFLSGGKIFIPVAQNNNGGGVVITLAEKEFGVGLKFTPTVLSNTRVNLKLVSEVSELSQTGSPFTTIGGVTSVLPSIATRRVDTTVQLNDGQSFAIAGLIKNNVTDTIKSFPGLGEVPVLGALFRSTEFQQDKTELVFIVTPRMVKPLTSPVALPTDNHVAPDRGDVLFMGRSEGVARDPEPAAQPQNK